MRIKLLKKSTKCDKGHKYDVNKHTSCPYCGVKINLEIVKNYYRQQNSTLIRSRHLKTIMPDEEQTVLKSTQYTDDDATVLKASSSIPHEESIITELPIRGWLVAIDGNSKYRDYHLYDGDNYTGIDFDGHLITTLKRNELALEQFKLKLDGDQFGLILDQVELNVNDHKAERTNELSDGDVLEFNGNKLMFQSLSGRFE